MSIEAIDAFSASRDRKLGSGDAERPEGPSVLVSAAGRAAGKKAVESVLAETKLNIRDADSSRSANYWADGKLPFPPPNTQA